jgi:hypothetical protein
VAYSLLERRRALKLGYWVPLVYQSIYGQACSKRYGLVQDLSDGYLDGKKYSPGKSWMYVILPCITVIRLMTVILSKILARIVAESPAGYLDKYVTEMEHACGKEVSISTLWRSLAHLGISHKQVWIYDVAPHSLLPMPICIIIFLVAQ